MRISDWSSDVCSSDLLLQESGGARSEPQVFDRLAVAADQAQGLDADLDVALDVLGAHLRVRGFGLDPFRDHRLVGHQQRSEEHTSELQSLMRNSYAVFCLKKQNNNRTRNT